MNGADEVSTLRADLARLRLQMRILFGVVVIAVVICAALAWNWHASSLRGEVNEMRAVRVEAQEFHLLDPDGRLRGMWRCPPAGHSWSMLDERGRLLIEVRQVTGSNTVKVLDESGRVLFEHGRQ
jgi:hypothetical protein